MSPEPFDPVATAVAALPSASPDGLPDVAVGRTAVAGAVALDWVGMRGLKLPLRWPQGDGEVVQLPASVTAQVNLVDAQARGIHMSRLYLACEEKLAAETLTPAALWGVLTAFLESHAGLSDAARLRLEFELLLRRPALRSPELAGWRSYPVWIEAILRGDGRRTLSVGLELLYASTCPASAALARQLGQQHFLASHGELESVRPQQVADWLASPAGMPATPHAQRSSAQLVFELDPEQSATRIPCAEWVDVLENALQTPVQTAVRRPDEQEFALRNGQNLMFCEDAARRLCTVLSADKRLLRWRAEVAHLESLHAHDAVAVVSGGRLPRA